MYAIAQIKYHEESDLESNLIFQLADKTSLKSFLHTNEYWNFAKFAQLLLKKEDEDYCFYLILE